MATAGIPSNNDDGVNDSDRPIGELVCDAARAWRRYWDLEKIKGVDEERKEEALAAFGACEDRVLAKRPQTVGEAARQLEYFLSMDSVDGSYASMLHHLLGLIRPQFADLARALEDADKDWGQGAPEPEATAEWDRYCAAREDLMAARPTELRDIAVQLKWWSEDIDCSAQRYGATLDHIVEQLELLAGHPGAAPAV